MEFILGIIFAILIMPILDGIANIILTFFEVLKSKMSTIIIKHNQAIQNQEDIIQRPIGFITPKEEEGDTDDDI